MHFEMSRVTEDDFDELLEIQYRAFEVVPLHEALFGPNTKEQRDAIKANFIKSMHTDPSDCWMKLVDKSNGRIVSGALWKIYPSWNDKEQRHDGEATWFEGEDRAMAEFLMKDFMDRRIKYMWNHPHVCKLAPCRNHFPTSRHWSSRRICKRFSLGLYEISVVDFHDGLVENYHLPTFHGLIRGPYYFLLSPQQWQTKNVSLTGYSQCSTSSLPIRTTSVAVQDQFK